MKDAKDDNLISRSPIVVVMGHIDHGKTTLLDFIKKTKVIEKEAGGITQHISAYEIDTAASAKASVGQRKITFLDTPGHEAFSKIRARGAKIADIAILVIAADDKVNEQTIESIEAIKKAKMPLMVVINKIDKENGDPERIKKELSEKEIQIEEWGGKIPCINISAKTGQGIDELLEMIKLMADIEDLKTDQSVNASGFILESYVDKKRGIGATLIIQNGTLKQGMYISSKNASAPVRIFEDFLGNPIKEASASSPIKIIGFNRLPAVGAEFESFASKKDSALKSDIDAGANHETEFHDDAAPTETKDKTIVPIIIKADTVGSAEAVEKQINQIPNEKIVFKILRASVGDINEDDIKLAGRDKNAIIIGFHIDCPVNVKTLAEHFNADVKLFDIIYKMEEWLENEAQKREPKETKEEIIGKAKILKIFRDEKNKKIIGGKMLSGKIAPNKYARILRKDILLGEGKILELQQEQAKVDEIKEGEQFGALIQTKVSIAPKDNLEIFEKDPA